MTGDGRLLRKSRLTLDSIYGVRATDAKWKVNVRRPVVLFIGLPVPLQTVAYYRNGSFFFQSSISGGCPFYWRNRKYSPRISTTRI
jgi:hypothetical protein